MALEKRTSASLDPGLLFVFLSGPGASSPNSEQGLAIWQKPASPSPVLSVSESTSDPIASELGTLPKEVEILGDSWSLKRKTV